MSKLQYFMHRVLSYKALDSLCIFLIFCGLVYELPATATAEIAASFGLYDSAAFYQYRVRFAALLIGVAGLNLLVNHRYVFKDKFFLLYAFFLTYLLAFVLINREMYGLEVVQDTESVSALAFYLPILFKYCLFFLIGFYLPRLFKYHNILVVVLLFLLCMIMYHVDFEIMGIDKSSYVDKKFYGNYLFLGDATSIASLITIAFFKNERLKIAFAILCAIAIFYIGSRTSFAVFAATVLLYFVVSFKPKYLLVSAICLVAVGFGLSTIDVAELEERNPRMFSVLTDFEGDNSVIGRQDLAILGWEDISANIITGNFGGQLTSGPPGAATSWRQYIHSVLSYWRQFGIVAFLIIVAFAVRCYSALWKHRETRKDTNFALYFLVSVFIFVETAFSRSFAFPYAHIFIGLTVAINYTMASNNKFRALADQYYQPETRERLPTKTSSGSKRKRRSRNKKLRF